MLLQKGSTGTEVANWQRFLISQGHDIDADGDFGPATETATKAFQRAQRLDPDGKAGELTLNAAEALKPKIGSIKTNPTTTKAGALARLNNVEPVLASKAQKILEMAAADGFTIQVSQGFRSFAEQNALFNKRPQVTRARGGQSMHNFGLAVDFVFIVGGKPSWDEKLYRNIGKWVDAVGGLEWGGRWKRFVDLPHVQVAGLPGYKPILGHYMNGGLDAVWKIYGAK